jgi:hypothetical protein
LARCFGVVLYGVLFHFRIWLFVLSDKCRVCVGELLISV